MGNYTIGGIVMKYHLMDGHCRWFNTDGDWPEPYATTLTDAARAFGNVDLYSGDDGKVWA